jgi:hypothetical protein
MWRQMQVGEEHSAPRMQPCEIYNLMRVHERSTPENALRKAWSSSKSSCKDVIALAMPLKPVPHSLDGFHQMLASNSKQQDFVTASFYIVYVGRCDGQDYGWSKAPYDNKNKKREEQKPLYTVDATGESKEQTRFWSFKKVSNNMNKGPRVDEKVDDKELSFVLKGGACFTVFLREDNYEEQKGIFEGAWEGEHENGIVRAYKPVLLQLSGTNDEQAMKGNGMKLRRVLPVAQEIMNDFADSFFESKQDLQALQTEIAELVPLRSVTKPMQGCPMLCKVQDQAFVYRDEDSGMLEIIDSGMDQSLGKKLLVSEQMLLTALYSNDVHRALRMLSVAIGHNAVKCVFVQSKSEGATSDAGTVVHLHVDMAEALWLNLLHKTRVVDSPSTLPKTSMLTMCFGKPIAESCCSLQAYTFSQQSLMPCLQWYAPSQLVQVATADNREVRCHVVFEMHLDMKQSSGQRDVSSKVLFMDEAAGFHYVVKVFHAETVAYTEENGLSCTKPTLLVTWQFRPGLVSSALSVSGIQRKRVFMSADTLDFMNTGEVMSGVGPPQELSEALGEEGPEERAKKKKKVV